MVPLLPIPVLDEVGHDMMLSVCTLSAALLHCPKHCSIFKPEPRRTRRQEHVPIIKNHLKPARGSYIGSPQNVAPAWPSSAAKLYRGRWRDPRSTFVFLQPTARENESAYIDPAIGRSPRGTRLVAQVPFLHGRSRTCIPLYRNPCDGAIWQDIIQ